LFKIIASFTKTSVIVLATVWEVLDPTCSIVLEDVLYRKLYIAANSIPPIPWKLSAPASSKSKFARAARLAWKCVSWSKDRSIPVEELALVLSIVVFEALATVPVISEVDTTGAAYHFKAAS